MNEAERQCLLDRARQGDGEALGAVLESLRPYVRLMVRALRDPAVQARVGESDLIQDALLEIHRCFAQFAGTTIPELIAWLRPIVLRTAAHVLRLHRARKRSVTQEETGSEMDAHTADHATSPSERAIRLEQAARVAEALEQLPGDMREVLLARHADDEPYAVIAERMNRTEGAVRVLYTRALHRLRELCGE